MVIILQPLDTPGDKANFISIRKNKVKYNQIPVYSLTVL